MRGAGLQERFPNRLRVGVLIGYNYISSCTRKIGSIPTPLEASCSFCATNSPDGVRWYSVGPTHPVRASALWASSWVSWGNIPHKCARFERINNIKDDPVQGRQENRPQNPE